MMHKHIQTPPSRKSDRQYWIEAWSAKRDSYIRKYVTANMPYQRVDARAWALHYSRLVRKMEGRA